MPLDLGKKEVRRMEGFGSTYVTVWLSGHVVHPLKSPGTCALCFGEEGGAMLLVLAFMRYTNMQRSPVRLVVVVARDLAESTCLERRTIL